MVNAHLRIPDIEVQDIDNDGDGRELEYRPQQLSPKRRLVLEGLCGDGFPEMIPALSVSASVFSTGGIVSPRCLPVEVRS